MSIHDAMTFIQKVAEEKALQKKIQALGDKASLADIVEIGAEARLEFSEGELRAVFAKDWAIRWAFYSHRKTE
jgi:predicted ribosomally synthesized peptide with nif11-like leader